MTERDDGPPHPHPAHHAERCWPRRCYLLGLRVVLVVVAIAHLRLGPSSSATTSTTERVLPSSACQDRCASRPTTTTRLPLMMVWRTPTEPGGRMRPLASPSAAVLLGWRRVVRAVDRGSSGGRHGVAEHVEVGLELIQALRLRLLEKPFGSPREALCIVQRHRGRKSRAESAPQAAAANLLEATADSRVDDVVASGAEATTEAAVRRFLHCYPPPGSPPSAPAGNLQ
jgi:hypothetical protein